MGARLIMNFESLNREQLTYRAIDMAYAAMDIIGESPWWSVEEAENESQA